MRAAAPRNAKIEPANTDPVTTTMAILTDTDTDRQSRPTPGEAGGHGSEDNDNSRLRVLIVEDDFLVAMTIEQAVRNAGMDVVGIAPTRARALAMGTELKPDFATMDINLRGDQAGTDIAREFRSRLGIRSLFITAYAGDREKTRAAEPADPLGWIDKPFTTDALVARLRRVERQLGEG